MNEMHRWEDVRLLPLLFQSLNAGLAPCAGTSKGD